MLRLHHAGLQRGGLPLSPLVAFVSAALAAETFEDRAYYAGDLHVHTGYSWDGASEDHGGGCELDIGCGSIEGLVQTARDNGLDFFAVTDHVNGASAPTEDAFHQVLQLLLAAHRPEDGFVTVPGAELFFVEAGGAPLGHKNVLFFGDNAALDSLTVAATQFDGTSTGGISCEDIWEHARDLSDAFGPLLVLPHHPAAAIPMVTDWDCQSAAWQPSVEAYSMHGSSFHAAQDFDPPVEGMREDHTLHAAYDLDDVRLGVHAATDNHQSRPGGVCDAVPERYGGGLTIAVLDESEAFDRASLRDALAGRSTLATSGPLVPVAVDLCSGGERLAGQGEDLEIVDGASVEVRARVPEAHRGYVTRVDLVMPQAISELSDSGEDWRITVVDPPAWMYVRVELDGEAWYGAAGCDDGGSDTRERIWTSVSYVDRTSGALPVEEGCPAELGDSDTPDTARDTAGGPPELVDVPPTRDDHTGLSPIEEAPAEDGPVVREEPRGACAGGASGLWFAALPLLLSRRRR